MFSSFEIITKFLTQNLPVMFRSPFTTNLFVLPMCNFILSWKEISTVELTRLLFSSEGNDLTNPFNYK